MKPAFDITRTASWAALARHGFFKIAFLNPGRCLFGYGAALKDTLGHEIIRIEPRYEYSSSTHGYRKVWWIAANGTGSWLLLRHWYVPTRKILSTVEMILDLQKQHPNNLQSCVQGAATSPKDNGGSKGTIIAVES